MSGRELSVIIPVYGTEKYISKCLDSAIRAIQGIDAEILIINDGTKDNAGEIAQTYASAYQNQIRYFVKENGGLADTKNYGLARAQGEFVTFLDSDDYVEPDIYSEMLYAAYAEEADCVVCDIIREDQNQSWTIYDKCAAGRDDLFYSLIDTPLMASSCNKIIKKSLLEGLYFPVGMNNEDITVTPIAMGLCQKLAYVPKGMYHYVQRDTSIQNTQFSEKRFVVIDAVQTALERADALPEVRREQLKGSLYVFQIIAVALYLIRREPFFPCFRYIKKYMDRVQLVFPDFFQNREVWEYTTWGSRKNNIFRKVSLFLLRKKFYMTCSLFWRVANILKEA